MSATNMHAAPLSQDPYIPADIARTVIDPAAYADEKLIYKTFKWLRMNNPLGIAQVEGYDPIWIVTKFSDIVDIGRRASVFPNGELNPILNSQADDDFMKSLTGGSTKLISSLTYMDGAEHSKYRKITNLWFMPANIAKLTDRIKPIAEATVEHMLSLGGSCDFVKDVALHYPLRIIMGLMGVPPEDEPYMLKLTQEFFGTHDPDEQRDHLKVEPDVAARMWHATLEDFYTFFDKKSAEKRASAEDDLISLIANSQVDGAPIPRDEANGYYVALATAGHDTTSSTSAGAVLGLCRFPAEFAKIKAQPELVSPLVEEALRWAAPVKHFMRSAAEDTELRGRQIRKMDRLMLCYPSANRDEDMVQNGDDFTIDRKPNRHLSFGSGPHVCLGQHLGKLEMRVLFDVLLPRLKSLELAGDPVYVKSRFVGGLKSLPVRFQAT